ncbi:hypothetical protein [Embleya sp. MST-111070]|uniref:hypothetical protein n=1 Tax=Embleya sp. MST-111070 TaxID=3398231 RepID=UPI003F73375C
MPAAPLRERARAGEVRLGGCVVWPDRAQWWCRACDSKLRREEGGAWTRVVAALGILGMREGPGRFVVGRDRAACRLSVPADWEFVAPVHAVLERIEPGHWRVSRPASATTDGVTTLRRGRTSQPLGPGEEVVIDDRIASALAVTDPAGVRRIDVEWTVFR